jgi:xylulokinase
MSDQLFIGVDIGTQAVKAAIYDERGMCHGEAFRKSELHRPSPGVVEEDPEHQVRSTCEVIAECAAKAAGKGPVRGLAIDGQMAGIIGVGEDGKRVTPYDSWLDTRCAPWIERMQKEAGPEIVRKSGGPPSFNHGPKILWWKNERPDVYRRIRAFVQPGGYAAMRLCGMDGSRAFIDRSYLHFSGFADSRKGTWDPKLCRTFGVASSLLPRIVAPHEVVGELSSDMAARCGLPPGTPVVAGCGDTAASFLSCGATRAGICVDVAGTASVFAATTADFRADEKEMVLSCGRSASPALWHPYAYINGGGMNLEWFREQVAGALALPPPFAPGESAASDGLSLERLNELAAAVTPGEEDPFFIPHLGGRVSPSQPHLRGAWVGLTWSHGPGHLYRAVLEGVALEYGIYMRTLEKLFGSGTVSEVRVTGGGEKSGVWNQIKADTLGVPILQVMGAGGAPLGSALLAGHGVGVLKDIDSTATQWIRTGTVTEPDPRRALICRRRVERYASLLESMNRWAVDAQ